MVQTNLGVMVFAATGAGEAGITFSDYHYVEDLASVATYTPPAQAQALLTTEGFPISPSLVNIEFNLAGWQGSSGTGLETIVNVFQDSGQNLRVKNTSGSAKWISLTGVTWTAGVADYHHAEALAASSTYTPSAKSISTLFGEAGEILRAQDLGLEYDRGGGNWEAAQDGTLRESTCLLMQDNDQSIRIKNADSGSTRMISLTGVTW